MRACLAVAMAVAMLLRVAADELVVAPSPAAAEHEQPARPRTPQPTAQANTGADADDADTPTRLHGAELAADDDVEGEAFPAAWTTLTDKQLTVGAGEEDVARFNEDSRAKGLQRNVIDGVLTAEQCTWLSRAFDDAKGCPPLPPSPARPPQANACARVRVFASHAAAPRTQSAGERLVVHGAGRGRSEYEGGIQRRDHCEHWHRGGGGLPPSADGAHARHTRRAGSQLQSPPTADTTRPAPVWHNHG